MTNPDLAALSAAATQGVWFDIEFGPEVGGRPDFHISCTWPDFIGVASMDNGLTSTAAEKKANAAFIVALVNAYRTGNLIQIDREGMRERVAEAIAQAMHGKGFCPFTHPETYDLCLQLADAAIAAILEGE